jgi:hypothetical protein
MKHVANLTGSERTVFVREYVRLRNGKWQVVACHFRRPRQERRG